MSAPAVQDARVDASNEIPHQSAQPVVNRSNVNLENALKILDSPPPPCLAPDSERSTLGLDHHSDVLADLLLRGRNCLAGITNEEE